MSRGLISYNKESVHRKAPYYMYIRKFFLCINGIILLKIRYIYRIFHDVKNKRVSKEN